MNLITSEITSRLEYSNRTVVGIAGGSASGKSYLAAEAAQELTEIGIGVVVINQDDFSIGRNFKQKRTSKYKWDDPANYRLNECLQVLTALQNNQTANFRAYNLADHEPVELKTLEPPRRTKSVIIIEGILAWYGQLKNEIDLKIYIDANFYRRFILRAYRNVATLKVVSLNKTIQQFFSHVLLAEQDILQPLRSQADIIIERQVSFDELKNATKKLASPENQRKILFRDQDAEIYIYEKANDSYFAVTIDGYTLFDEKLEPETIEILAKVTQTGVQNSNDKATLVQEAKTLDSGDTSQ